MASTAGRIWLGGMVGPVTLHDSALAVSTISDIYDDSGLLAWLHAWQGHSTE